MADVIKPLNEACILQVRGKVKLKLGDYEGALKDLDQAHAINPNHACILRVRGEVKQMLGDHHGALEDLNKADFLESEALEDLNKADILELDSDSDSDSNVEN
jgi:tetratricopeptide (TPR) repeat protein